ncbi:hypothetical protein [Candidatus Protochlamydia phocaeensis]|uniref:hypothetical protein n=1 Tax=Candidatus Protochlamydia phocaeensis TaxID=1414722 RepID=UPI0008396594|nr:hypothetical protein [Candidatus Protochlamydia phocaeensis]
MVSSVSFLSTLNQTFQDAPVISQSMYASGHQFAVCSANSIPANCSRMPSGQIAKYAQQYLNAYSREEKVQLKSSLLQLKARVEQKRSCFLLKRIFITFLSAIRNYFQGLGFVDSRVLVNRALDCIRQDLNQLTLAFRGDISFGPDEQELLLKSFSEENRQALRQRKPAIRIDGEEIAVKYYGLNIPVFELDPFPGVIFKLSYTSDKMRDRYQAMVKAKEVCRENNLQRLIVPDCSLLEISAGEETINIVAERKYDIKHGKHAQQIAFTNHESELEDIVRQLAILICKTGFADVKWDNIPLIHMGEVWRVLLIDLEPHDQFGSKGGLIGWGEGNGWGSPTPGLMGCCPRYAELIYSIAKEHLSSEDFEAMRPALEEARAKAQEINRRNESIEAFHRARGVTAETPAVDLMQVDLLDIEEEKRELYRAILSDINEVLMKQGEMRTDLKQAREWRLTMDYHTVDSNYKKTIGQHFFEIADHLLPWLQQKGLIHSVLNADEATNLNIDLRKPFGKYDKIVQF